MPPPADRCGRYGRQLPPARWAIPEYQSGPFQSIKRRAGAWALFGEYIGLLTEEERQVLRLSAMGDTPYRVARAMGTTEARVRQLAKEVTEKIHTRGHTWQEVVQYVRPFIRWEMRHGRW